MGREIKIFKDDKHKEKQLLTTKLVPPEIIKISYTEENENDVSVGQERINFLRGRNEWMRTGKNQIYPVL